MNNSTSILGETVEITKRCVCVLALVLVFLAVGVVGVPSREARAQESCPMGATVSPEPNADGGNNCEATVTLRARFKTH